MSSRPQDPTKEPVVIQISPIRTLYDLNGTKNQFNLRVFIQSGEGEFEYASATQTEIDNDTIKYTTSTGGSGSLSVVNNSEDYQNYFLVVRTPGERVIEAKYWIESSNPVQVQGVVAPPSQEGSGKSNMKSNLSILIWLALLAMIIMMTMKKK